MIGNKYDTYFALLLDGKRAGEAMNELGLKVRRLLCACRSRSRSIALAPPPFSCSLSAIPRPLQRYCCRRMILTHVDLIDKLLAYNVVKR